MYPMIVRQIVEHLVRQPEAALRNGDDVAERRGIAMRGSIRLIRLDYI